MPIPARNRLHPPVLQVTEAARGQRAVTEHDYALLPRLLNNPDQVEDGGRSDTGRQILRHARTIDGERYIAAFEIRAGRKMLVLQSLWIGKGL